MSTQPQGEGEGESKAEATGLNLLDLKYLLDS